MDERFDISRRSVRKDLLVGEATVIWVRSYGVSEDWC